MAFQGLAQLPRLKEFYVDGNKLTGVVPKPLCDLKLNAAFVDDPEAAQRCDGVSCPTNSISQEGVAPCVLCPDNGGQQRYLGQHGSECQGARSEEDILDLFFDQTHGKEWRNASYAWEKGSPACQRQGIKCSSGHVTEITLPSLGLRGPITSDLGYLTNLSVLDLRNNRLTGFLPSDLRFVPLTRLDISGSQVEGVVPPLLCLKEGINGNGGPGPPGTDLNVLYACDNIACPRGTYSRLGRAAPPIHEGDTGVRCAPCLDGRAALYLGRDRCADLISIADAVHGGPGMVVLMALAAACLVAARAFAKARRTFSAGVADSNNCEGGWCCFALFSSPQPICTPDDSDHSYPYDDCDWSAGDSETTPSLTSVELPKSKPRLPDMS